SAEDGDVVLDAGTPGSGDADSGRPSGSGDAGPDSSVDGGSSTYRAEVLVDLPIAYFRFGQATGAAAAKNESSANAGAYGSGVTLGAPGAIACDPDTAAHFDGTGAVDAGTAFDFAGDQAFTVEMWVKPDSVDAQYRRLFERLTFDGTGAKD